MLIEAAKDSEISNLSSAEISALISESKRRAQDALAKGDRRKYDQVVDAIRAVSRKFPPNDIKDAYGRL